MNFRYSDLGQWPESILKNSESKMISLLNERVSTGEQSARLQYSLILPSVIMLPRICMGNYTVNQWRSSEAILILRRPLCLLNRDTFNSLVRYIQGSRWYGRFNFANSISSLSTYLSKLLKTEICPFFLMHFCKRPAEYRCNILIVFFSF